MELKEQLKQMIEMVQNNKLLFIDGNNNDLYGERWRDDYKELREYILENIDRNPSKYLWFKPGVGSKNICRKSSKINTNETVKSFIKKTSDLINSAKSDAIIHLDFTNKQSTLNKTKENGNMLLLLEALYKLLEVENDAKVIITADDSSIIKDYLYSKNEEYSSIELLMTSPYDVKEYVNYTDEDFLISDKDYSDMQWTTKDSFKGFNRKQIRDLFLDRKMLPRAEELIAKYKNLSDKGDLDKSNEKLNSPTFWKDFDYGSIVKLDKYLNQRVYGQSYATNKTIQVLKRSFLGLSSPFHGASSKKPKGILFYCGPTGVGKTELAKALTTFLFDDETNMTRFDMSEYAEKHSNYRFFGSPPGYIGSDKGGQLTNAVINKPNSVLLFDEIEKAHPQILDSFLQILEDGRMTSGMGAQADFSGTVIIFTSNIGTSAINYEGTEEEIRNGYLIEIEKHFLNINRPEILNRIGKDNIIPFGYMKDIRILQKVLGSKLKNQNKILVDTHHIKLKWSSKELKDMLNILINDPAYDPKYGVRGMMDLANSIITDKIIEFIIHNNNDLKAFTPEKPYLLKPTVSEGQVIISPLN